MAASLFAASAMLNIWENVRVFAPVASAPSPSPFPPLRQRREEIPFLMPQLIARAANELDRQPIVLSERVLAAAVTVNCWFGCNVAAGYGHESTFAR
jgi:hypothetical protein